MTPKQRVITAFGCQKADRIPRYEVFLPGFGGIQSLAPIAGTWLPDARKRWNRFQLVGGMCNIGKPAKGNRAGIQSEAEAIGEVAKDGGVVIGIHSIDESIPVENYDWCNTVLEKCDRNW